MKAYREHVEGGGEKYLPWARQRLSVLDGFRKSLNLPVLSKHFRIEGSDIWVKATEWGHTIRVTGGQVPFAWTGAVLGVAPTTNLSHRIWVAQPTMPFDMTKAFNDPVNVDLRSPTPRNWPTTKGPADPIHTTDSGGNPTIIQATERLYSPMVGGQRTHARHDLSCWWGVDIHRETYHIALAPGTQGVPLLWSKNGKMVRRIYPNTVIGSWFNDDGERPYFQRDCAPCGFFTEGAFLDRSPAMTVFQPIMLWTTGKDANGNFEDLDCNSPLLLTGYTDTLHISGIVPGGSIARNPGFTLNVAGTHVTNTFLDTITERLVHSIIGLRRLFKVRSRGTESSWTGPPQLELQAEDMTSFGTYYEPGAPGFFSPGWHNTPYKTVLYNMFGGGRSWTDANLFYTKQTTTNPGGPFPGPAPGGTSVSELWVNNTLVFSAGAVGFLSENTSAADKVQGGNGTGLRFFFHNDLASWFLYDRGAVYSNAQTWFGLPFSETESLKTMSASGRCLAVIPGGASAGIPDMYEWDDEQKKYVFRAVFPNSVFFDVFGSGRQDYEETDMMWAFDGLPGVGGFGAWKTRFKLVKTEVDAEGNPLPTPVYTVEKDQYCPNQVPTEQHSDYAAVTAENPQGVYGSPPYGPNPHTYTISGFSSFSASMVQDPISVTPR
jgi:hypothetical protein